MWGSVHGRVYGVDVLVQWIFSVCMHDLCVHVVCVLRFTGLSAYVLCVCVISNLSSRVGHFIDHCSPFLQV